MFNTNFSNKTQLKIYIFILLSRTRFNVFLALDMIAPLFSGSMLHCSCEQWNQSMAPLFSDSSTQETVQLCF